MDASHVRKVLCWLLLIAFPVSLMAADVTPAMLYAKGAAWINGASVPDSSAVFPGDLVQTTPESTVNINATGSRILVLSDSLVKFEGEAVGLEHGTVRVVTSKGMRTQAGDVKVTPLSSDWTEFDVADTDGTVQIIARKGDLRVDDGKQTSTLAQGQQTTRDESQDPNKKKKRRGGAAVAATGSIMNSTGAILVGAGAITGVAVWVYTRGDDPISPTR
ncbi:MAG TPA: hypothetical protein VFA68_07900 [Terriglobales bacterium]|nr:hypothetical protein [Terriglobales bacterium]